MPGVEAEVRHRDALRLLEQVDRDGVFSAMSFSGASSQRVSQARPRRATTPLSAGPTLSPFAAWHDAHFST